MMSNNKPETTRDTLLDLMGYALIGITMLDKTWGDSNDGVYNPVTRLKIWTEMHDLFDQKLKDYGTHDLDNISQVAQRMKEKTERVLNMHKPFDSNGAAKVHSTSSGSILVKKHNKGHDGFLYPKKTGDVGYDLVTSEDFVLPPHGNASAAFVVPAGVSIKAPGGYFCMIVGRSSAAKRGVGIQTAVIDNGYTGPMFGCSWNMTSEEITVKKGEKIAQVVFFPVCVFPIEHVGKLPTTERGETGFGSTGA